MSKTKIESSNNVEATVIGEIASLLPEIIAKHSLLQENSKKLTRDNQAIVNANNINYFKQHQIAAAVSGGADSLALALILNNFAIKNNIKFTAITVDHQIREGSTIEAKMVNQILKNNKINHQILTLEKNNLPQSNIEENLRIMRYQAIANYCKIANINLIFFGHQQDDVAENFLIRLFRGSGINGLASIAKVTIGFDMVIIRPMLNISKEQIINFLQINNVQYFTDESNSNEKFLRNKIRNFLNSFAEKEQIKARISKTATIITELRDSETAKLLNNINFTIYFNKNKQSFQIDYQQFIKLPQPIAITILQELLTILQPNRHQPRYNKIVNLFLAIASKTFCKNTLHNCQIVKQQEIIIIKQPTTKTELLEAIALKIKLSIISTKIEIVK